MPKPDIKKRQGVYHRGKSTAQHIRFNDALWRDFVWWASELKGWQPHLAIRALMESVLNDRKVKALLKRRATFALQPKSQNPITGTDLRVEEVREEDLFTHQGEHAKRKITIIG